MLCKVHGFCVAGGTDMALCSDLLVIAADARIGYPPARVWGSPTTSMWLAPPGPPAGQAAAVHRRPDHRRARRPSGAWPSRRRSRPPSTTASRSCSQRVAALPVNQLVMMKLLVNQQLEAQGLGPTQVIGTLLDGIARHTPEGFAFQQKAMAEGWQAAVAERDGTPALAFHVLPLPPNHRPACRQEAQHRVADRAMDAVAGHTGQHPARGRPLGAAAASASRRSSGGWRPSPAPTGRPRRARTSPATPPRGRTSRRRTPWW